MNKVILTVESVLDYYSENVVDALATALVTTDQFPEEALNEVRASYTHLSRAHKHRDDAQTLDKELGSAKRHLQRVCLDSLKICVLASARRADDMITALSLELNLPNQVHNNAAVLRTKRKEIMLHESRETTLGVIDRMKDLFNDYDEFNTRLEQEFGGNDAITRTRLRKSKALKDKIMWTVGGAMLGAVLGITLGLIFS